MLIDTTLREGAQLFGAYFSVDMREKIANGLLALGVEEMEIGWIGQEGLGELISRLRPVAGRTKLSVWTPCRDADIREAAALDVDRINVGVPVSDSHISARLKTNRDGLRERVARTLLTAGLLGIKYLSVGLEDVSRADAAFALSLAQTAEETGAARIRLSDSLGVLTPPETQRLVTAFRNNLSIDLAVHCHNDFGMATGNAISALSAGSNYADVSVLGIGERSGIAATEEVAAYLSIKETTHDYETAHLRPLCHTVAQAAGISVPRTKPIAGKDIFSCESGIHAHALSKSTDLFEPYSPQAIGAERVVAVGGKSGRAAVAQALGNHDITRQRQEIPALVSAVRKLSWELKRPLSDSEFTELVKRH